MAISENKVRLQVVVDKDVADKIEELAALLQVSTSNMSARLLKEAINDNEWIIRVISSPLGKGIAKILGKKPRTVGDKAGESV